MKKFTVVLLIGLLSLASLFAGGANEESTAQEETERTVLRVAANPTPHAELLNLVVDDLAEEGIDLEVIEFQDYVVPNEVVEDGSVDANFVDHIPYLEAFNREHGSHLVPLDGIHVEPFALYSDKYTSVDEIPDGATIAIPNDPANEARALLLLENAGLLTLSEDAGTTATPIDIVDNPKNLQFSEIDAATLPRILQDVDGAIINGNYAIPAGLVATRDGLIVEDASSPYVNIIAVKEGNEDNPAVHKLIEALKSDEVREYVKEKYPNGEIVLVF